MYKNTQRDRVTTYRLDQRQVAELYTILRKISLGTSSDKPVHFHEAIEILSSINEFTHIYRTMDINWNPINYEILFNYSGKNIKNVLSTENAHALGYDSLPVCGSKTTLAIVHPADKSVSFITFYVDIGNTYTGTVELSLSSRSSAPILVCNDRDILVYFLNGNTVQYIKQHQYTLSIQTYPKGFDRDTISSVLF